MTVTEFSNQFDILYNGIATNSAPPIDLYEKSVYLTKAQLELVKNYFNPKGNKYRDGFEQSSKRRIDLNELIKGDETVDIATTAQFPISDNSVFFKIRDDVFLIIQETAKFKSDDPCLDGKYVKCVPKTHDEYNIQIDNPFKAPYKDLVWRIDYQSQEGRKNVELISPIGLAAYKYRYVKFPSPIILTDLDSAFLGEGLSIDGITAEQTCLLDQSIHREILDRAVEMATADYKPEALAVKTQINTRNE